MTPKEKALELIEKTYNGVPKVFDEESGIEHTISISCALLHVNDKLKTCKSLIDDYSIIIKYWEEVKQEIESL